MHRPRSDLKTKKHFCSLFWPQILQRKPLSNKIFDETLKDLLKNVFGMIPMESKIWTIKTTTLLDSRMEYSAWFYSVLYCRDSLLESNNNDVLFLSFLPLKWRTLELFKSKANFNCGFQQSGLRVFAGFPGGQCKQRGSWIQSLNFKCLNKKKKWIVLNDRLFQ